MTKAFAPGKIILSGEYAVVFGYPGVAIPSPFGLFVSFEEGGKDLNLRWKGIVPETERWDMYLRHIVLEAEHVADRTFRGTLTVSNNLPLGKGMGSSTALLIATMKCLLGEACEREANAIEDALNAGHSGIDFAVIWSGAPLLFRKGKPQERATLDTSFLRNAVLIDTGTPNESTSDLVAWVTLRQAHLDAEHSMPRQSDITEALETIGRCTERLLRGEDPMRVMRDHHRAQVMIGVVPEVVQDLIAGIEAIGGAAKVLGAGARTGGGGMVLALHLDPERTRQHATAAGYAVL